MSCCISLFDVPPLNIAALQWLQWGCPSWLKKYTHTSTHKHVQTHKTEYGLLGRSLTVRFMVLGNEGSIRCLSKSRKDPNGCISSTSPFRCFTFLQELSTAWTSTCILSIVQHPQPCARTRVLQMAQNENKDCFFITSVCLSILYIFSGGQWSMQNLAEWRIVSAFGHLPPTLMSRSMN